MAFLFLKKPGSPAVAAWFFNEFDFSTCPAVVAWPSPLNSCFRLLLCLSFSASNKPQLWLYYASFSLENGKHRKIE
jgi:hypothetical protein